MSAVHVTITLMLAKKKDLNLACYTCLAALLVCTQPANAHILSALYDAWLCKIRLFFYLRVCCKALGACKLHQSNSVLILKSPNDSAAFKPATPAGLDCYAKVLQPALIGTMVVADASDTEKDLSPLARANSENPWGPKRTVGSFTSGVSGRARGDASPRLRGAYAEIQIKV